MILVDVYSEPKAIEVLYRLLKERPPGANISHRGDVSLESHEKFVSSRPYSVWYLVKEDADFVGSVYLTKLDEIGVFVFKARQRRGVATEAIKKLLFFHHRTKYLANINPENVRSIRLFEKLGFCHIQNTYSK